MANYDFEKLNRVIEGQEVPSNAEDNSNYIPQQEGNLVFAIIAGLLSSVLIASLWALITVNAQKQWMIMGILAGFAVGYVVHLIGRGRTIPISLIGGFFALLSCVLGDYFTNVGFIAQEEGLAYFETLTMIDNTYFFEIAFADFDFFSLIVYGIAAYEGFAICYKTDS
ncbi:hypothetical protein PRMUPPPA20_25450 [Xylanibacter ruminicola]|uniref:Uncharacterized protein n=1 Tax=Xylanibacter ruminicola TaxID=839 RepID=A0AA37I347_XYLRU|nr:hypothetical protein [Xylanibacter ruminicola]GJG34436.1 hypothetical protein PRMUPPPA20_25450 [Xylanibacter ruminicola]SEH59247.1 hypothetical protein SAMN02745192_0186 [Xylanibacter ruminicola]